MNSFRFFSPLWRCGPTRGMVFSCLRFLDHTQRRITVGRTPLDEWSARRRDLYLTTQNIHSRQTSMPPVEFEPTISAGERPQTYALDRTATGLYRWHLSVINSINNKKEAQSFSRNLSSYHCSLMATCSGFLKIRRQAITNVHEER